MEWNHDRRLRAMGVGLMRAEIDDLSGLLGSIEE
jgi:hypothetical protein